MINSVLIVCGFLCCPLPKLTAMITLYALCFLPDGLSTTQLVEQFVHPVSTILSLQAFLWMITWLAQKAARRVRKASRDVPLSHYVSRDSPSQEVAAYATWCTHVEFH